MFTRFAGQALGALKVPGVQAVQPAAASDTDVWSVRPQCTTLLHQQRLTMYHIVRQDGPSLTAVGKGGLPSDHTVSAECLV